MKNNHFVYKPLMFIVGLSILLAGCASMFMNGGILVDAGYKEQKVIAVYRTEGTVPPGVQYSLVQTDKGVAIFEKSRDGSGTLFLNHWKDNKGDHYAGWVSTSHAYEYVIPADRKAKGEKYVYPRGTFSIQNINGVDRPVPHLPVEPVATLIPK